MSISDQIVVMKLGVLQQIGQPQEVYNDPINLFVAQFLGTPAINTFSGEVKDGQVFIGDEAVLPAPGVPDQKVFVGIRPEGFIPDEKLLEPGAAEPEEPHDDGLPEWVYDLPGVDFRVIHYKPFFGGSAGKLLHGVQFFYTDYPSAVITLTQFYVMQAVNELWPGHNPMKSLGSGSMLDNICGTDYVRLHFAEEMKVSEIESYWMKDVETFKTLSRKYYIYY